MEFRTWIDRICLLMHWVHGFKWGGTVQCHCLRQCKFLCNMIFTRCTSVCAYIHMHCIGLHTWNYSALPCGTLQAITLQYITLHCIRSHCVHRIQAGNQADREVPYGPCVVVMFQPWVNGRSLLELGPSGSGKSTLLKVLLEKFFPDYQGPLCHGRSLEKVSLVAGASRLCLFTGWNFKEEFETDC